MTKLKPCPFCGGEAYFDKDGDGWQWIECEKCHVATNQRTSAMEDCKPLLAEAWNTRSAIDSDAIRAAALKDAADMAVSWQVKLCSRDDWHCGGCTECNQLRYAILSAEPAQDDGKPEANHRLLECSVCGNLEGVPYEQGDSCTMCGVGVYRAVEVKRRLEESKE